MSDPPVSPPAKVPTGLDARAPEPRSDRPAGSPRPAAHRRRAFAALAALLAVLGTLGAAEVAARLLERDPPPTAARKIPLASPKLFTPRFQAMGQPLGRVPGEYRIVVLGDSMSWGWRMHPEDAWPSRLEWRLRPLIRPAATLHIVNAARPNWNTVQQHDFLRARVDDLAPDAVVLGFCLNDPEPNGNAGRLALDALRRRRSPERPVSRWLHDWSTLYRTLWERLENARLRRTAADIYRDTFREDSADWRACVEALIGMRATLAARHVPFLVVLIPFFDDPFDARYPLRYVHQQFERMCAEQGLDCIDLLPAFEGLEVTKLATEPSLDGHPNEIAQRIIADELIRPLLARGMLPVEVGRDGRPVTSDCRIDVATFPPRERARDASRPRPRPRPWPRARRGQRGAS